MAKSGEISFILLETKKATFVAKNVIGNGHISKSKGALPPCPLPTPMHVGLLSFFLLQTRLFVVYWQQAKPKKYQKVVRLARRWEVAMSWSRATKSNVQASLAVTILLDVRVSGLTNDRRRCRTTLVSKLAATSQSKQTMIKLAIVRNVLVT